ncbi:hypothetical protein SSX86_030010 [Deinandra increscens subsp. villosa]|uniref:Uncharacterized protein n=1 Tax=Deinandra increscens subsp. villosa TaxID=3103831 RepID=A0AAP0CGR9_9ASTR
MSDKADPKPQPLHPVYTVTNIQHKVPVLDGVDITYPTWVKLFKLHVTGYDVVQHIDGSPAPEQTSTDYSSWKKIDVVVLQWVYVASLLNQSLPSWETACDQLQSEARRLAAREHISPTPLVAAAVASQSERSRDQQPPSNRESQNRDFQNRRPNSRRDSNRNQRSNSRGPGQHQNRAYSAQAPPYIPHWAPQQAYAPYWVPPPYPFPTQNWAQSWAPPQANNTAHSKNKQAQAHITETNPLQPTQLAQAVETLSMESTDDQWHLDTGASSHVTYDPGFQGWHDPESSQQFK